MKILTIGIIVVGVVIIMMIWGVTSVIKEKERTKRVLGKKASPVVRQKTEATTPPTVLAENLHKVWKN